MTSKIFLTSTFLFLFLISCKTQQTSIVTGDTYDPKTNTSTLIQIPYGNINIPDKWVKTSYNQSSKQTLYSNQDSITIAVTKVPKNKYPFYKAGQSDKVFVMDFFKWDSEYWASNGVTIKQLNDSSDKGFIIWKATAKNVNTIFLFGSKNNLAYNFGTMTTKWTDEQSATFLIDLFNQN